MSGTKFARQLVQSLTFMDHYAKRKFWHDSSGKNSIRDFFSWSDLNQCISNNRITNDRFRLSTQHEHLSVNRRAFRESRDRNGVFRSYLVISELHNLLREGVSAVLESVNEVAREVENLTDTLAYLLGAQSTANAYMSFGSTSGFGPHNDDHDVLVFQIEGQKKWRFFKATGGVDKATIKTAPSIECLQAGSELVLAEGNMLYVPKGMWHDVVSMDQKSLHLTVSLVYPTIQDFFAWCIRSDCFGEPFEDIRPTVVSREAALLGCHRFMDESLSNVKMNAFLKIHYAGIRASRLYANFPSLNVISLENYFHRIPFQTVRLSDKQDGSDVSVFALGSTHTLSILEYEILEMLLCEIGTRGTDMVKSGGLSAHTVEALQRLVDIGWVNFTLHGDHQDPNNQPSQPFVG